MQMEVDYDASQEVDQEEHPTKMMTRSQAQAQRQFGRNITNDPQRNNRHVRQKRRLDDENENDRPLKKRRQANVDSDGDMDMRKVSSSVDMDTSENKDDTRMSPEGEESEPEVYPWDLSDVNNPLACIEYVKDIVLALREKEETCHQNIDFMSQQSDINARMRTILLDWLVEVNLKFKLKDPTFYLAVNILDRYLTVEQVNRSKLQLTGCACLWIAAKYHEIYAPEMGDFVYMSDNAFTREDLLETESNICEKLDFNLTMPTPLAFAERYIKIAHYDLDEKQRNFVKNFSYYLIEHSLMDYTLSRERPSLIASASVAFSLLVARSPVWDERMVRQTTYTMEDLTPTMNSLKSIVVNPKCKHRAIRKKYSNSKFGKVEAVVQKYGKQFDIQKLMRIVRKSKSVGSQKSL